MNLQYINVKENIWNQNKHFQSFKYSYSVSISVFFFSPNNYNRRHGDVTVGFFGDGVDFSVKALKIIAKLENIFIQQPIKI